MNMELEIAREIRRVFCDTRWIRSIRGVRYAHFRSDLMEELMEEVDADTWADLAHRLGWGADWAISWIKEGYPSPPDWMYFGVDAEEKHRAKASK